MAEEAAEQTLTQPEEGAAGAKPLAPLAISGVVVSKAQLLEALRAYIPNISDFPPLADGEHFSILFSPDSQGRSS